MGNPWLRLGYDSEFLTSSRFSTLRRSPKCKYLWRCLVCSRLSSFAYSFTTHLFFFYSSTMPFLGLTAVSFFLLVCRNRRESLPTMCYVPYLFFSSCSTCNCTETLDLVWVLPSWWQDLHRASGRLEGDARVSNLVFSGLGELVVALSRNDKALSFSPAGYLTWLCSPNTHSNCLSRSRMCGEKRLTNAFLLYAFVYHNVFVYI